jgi:hypothetical protein
MTQPPETAPSSPRRVSHVQISFDLPEGVCLQFTVEALPADGQAEAGEAGDSRLPVEIVVRPLGASKALPAGAGRVQAVITPAEVSPAALVSVEAQACPQDAPAPGGAASLQETVTLSPARATPARRIRLPGAAPASLGKWIEALRERSAALAAALFGLSLAVYLAVRLIGLASFPIYFFTDEAVQTVLAADLVRDGFLSYEGVFLPTYFKNGNYYNLSLSVYLQVLPTLLFGKTVFVTRAVSVLVSLLAALSVGLILRRILKASLWWSGVLLLSLSPAWFLHSRTAFETVIFVSFYAATLAGYLLYRYHSPRFLYPTLVLAALAF